MNLNRFGTIMLLGAMVLAAILGWLLRLSIDSELATFISAICVIIIIPFGIYGALFLLVLPFGFLNSLLEDSVKEAQSPFAGDRLPEQIIAPDADPERAH